MKLFEAVNFVRRGMRLIYRTRVKDVVLVSPLIYVHANYSSMTAILSPEKEDVKATVMAGTLTNEMFQV